MKVHLDDSGRLNARSEDVLLGRHVVLVSKAVKIVQEAATMVFIIWLSSHSDNATEIHFKGK